jgi:galactonate dehydratase
MYRSQYFEGGRALVAAIAAIDIALHDIAGKALGVPVYQLLGGKHRDYIPCFVTIGAPDGPQFIERLQAAVAQGWPCIRTGIAHPKTDDPQLFEPRESIPLTATWLTKGREAVGLAPVLGIDYHHRLSVAEAASFCQRMPTGTLDWIEEPIRDETPEAYAELRKLTPTPFALGEEFSSKWAFVPYIERGLSNLVRVDLCNVGGFTEAMKVAGWAEAHYTDLMPHNPLGPICAAATIHLAAAVPNFAWLEVFVNREGALSMTDPDVFTVQPQLEGIRFPVPTAPGLGIEVNEKLVAERAFKWAEFPHLHRRDGSHTNW